MNHIESAILSGIVQHGESAIIDVADIISSNSFTDKTNQVLFSIFSKILADGVNIDRPTVISYANNMSFENFIDKHEKYVDELLSANTDLKNIRQHAKSLMKHALIKKAKEKHKIAFQKLEELNGTETVDYILSVSESPIFDLLNETFESSLPAKIAENWEEYMQEKEDQDGKMLGIPTPYPIFNKMTGGGLRTGGVTLIGSRAGVGKSTFGKECAVFAARQGIPVLFIDTEMVKSEQLDRIVSSMTKIPISEVESGEFMKSTIDKNKVLKAKNDILSLPIYHKEVYGKVFEEVLSIIRRWIIKEVGFDENGKSNPCLVVYDYFKLMSDDSLKEMQEFQALGFQISKLTDFCKEYNFPCLSFVQLNRDGITKETGDVFAQSDRLLWLCLTAAIFKNKTEEELAQSQEYGNMKLIPVKTRFGSGSDCVERGDYINMHFHRDISTLEEGLTFHNAEKERKKHERSEEYSSEDWS